MENLIKALQIFLKYKDKLSDYQQKYPTACDHDILYVSVNPEIVSDEDKKELERLGFEVDIEEFDCFYSNHYASC